MQGASMNTTSILPSRPFSGSGFTGERTCRLRTPGPLAAADGVGQPPGVGVVGVDLAGVAHGARPAPGSCRRRRRRGRAPACPSPRRPRPRRSASPGPAPRTSPWRTAGWPRPRRCGSMGSGAGDAQRGRQEVGRLGAERRQRLQRPRRVGLQGVDPQVHRRALGQGRALLRPRLAEGARQGGVEPVGIVAAHGGRRLVEVARRLQRRALGVGQRRPARAARRRPPRRPAPAASPRRTAARPARRRAALSSPIRQPSERRRRSTSSTRPETKARSLAPA